MAFAPNTEWLKELHEKDMQALDHEVRIRATNFKNSLAITQMEKFVSVFIILILDYGFAK